MCKSLRARFSNLPVCVLIAAALLSTLLLAQSPSSAWKQYSYPSDGFAFSAPGQPTFSQQTKPTDAGNIDIHTYTVAMGDSGVVMISSSEIKGLARDLPKDRLQKAKLGALQAGNAKLTSEHSITLGGYPGLQFEAEAQNLHVRARMYIVRNKLFQLLEISPIATAFPEDAERICNSFKLVPTQ